MKIYQIHEYGGSWEDAYDYIIGSYLHKERAELALKEFIKREEELKNCNKCPLYYCPLDCDGIDCGTKQCDEFIIKRTKEYCKEYKPTKKDKCANFTHYYEDSDFRLEEVEVIE